MKLLGLKRMVLFFIILIFNTTMRAQETKMDSLQNLLKQHSQDDTTKVNLLNELAYGVRRTDIEKVLHYATLAGRLADSLDYKKGKASSFQNIGIYYYYKHDFAQSLSYQQQSLSISESIGDKHGMAYSSNYIGNINLTQGNYEIAMNFYREALKAFLAIGDKVGMSGCYNNIGNIYYAQSDYPHTLECFHNALKVFEELDNKVGISGSYNNIGVVYDDQGNYPKALEYYEKALAMRQLLGDDVGIADCYINIGNIYAYQDDNIKALEFYQKALSIHETLGDQQSICVAHFNVGIAYYSQNDYEMALSCFEKSKNIAEKIDYQNMVTENDIEFSKVYAQQKYYNKAIYYGELGYRSANESGELDNIMEASTSLASSYAALGNYKKAYAYHLIFKAYSDSVFNESNVEAIANLESQYKFDKEKELMAVEQRQKDTLQQAELLQQKKLRNFFIIGFVLMLVLVLLIFRSLDHIRKTNLQLKQQKGEIEKQSTALKESHQQLLALNQFKEGMTSMIVHDLKNPLNSIINSSSTFSLEQQVKHVKQVGRQMLTMVLNILDVNKYENNVMRLDKLPVALLGMVQNAVDEVEFLADQKGILIEKAIDAQTGVLVDSEIIQRVLVNLLSNAIKYTPNNGHVRVFAEGCASGLVKVSVQDTGEGIPADKLHLVFDKFKQLDARHSGRIRSTGLGLTFCKMAVEAHGGTIVAKSEINKGTIFEFTLEAAKILSQQVGITLPVQAKKTFELSVADQELLLPFIQALKELEIYKLFEIRKIIRTIDDKDNTNIQSWKEALLNAVMSGNKEKYAKFLVL